MLWGQHEGWAMRRCMEAITVSRPFTGTEELTEGNCVS